MKKKLLIIFVFILGIGLGVGGTILVYNFIDNEECAVETAEEIEEEYTETIKDKEITIKNFNEEAYVIEGLPETVDVTITGDSKKKVKEAMESEDLEIVLDLEDIEPSKKEIEVKLKCENTIKSITYEIEPKKVSIYLKEKNSTIKTLSYDLENIDSLPDTLMIDSVTLSTSDVVIKGSEDTIKKVASVKALIDVSANDIDEEGTYNYKKVKLVAYDKKGDKVDVEIVPSTIKATIEVKESYSKEVPVKVVLTAPPKKGKEIKLVSINGEKEYKVRIYGNKKSIDKIDEINAIIDASDLKEEKTFDVTLTKPDGVDKISEEKVEVVIKPE